MPRHRRGTKFPDRINAMSVIKLLVRNLMRNISIRRNTFRKPKLNSISNKIFHLSFLVNRAITSQESVISRIGDIDKIDAVLLDFNLLIIASSGQIE